MKHPGEGLHPLHRGVGGGGEDGLTRRRVSAEVPPICTVPLISSPFTVNSPATVPLVLLKRNTSPATVPLTRPPMGPGGLGVPPFC